MRDPIVGEDADRLLALARANGLPITRTQLARWHRADLLPRPTPHGLGRGEGTKSIYPPGTSEQLLALLAIRAHERRLSVIAWRLWWEGYDSPTKRIMANLRNLAAEWERKLRKLMKEGVLTKAGEAFIAETREAVFGDRLLRRTRRRVGKERFPSFMQLLLEILSGGFERFYDSDDAKILESGLGAPFRIHSGHASSSASGVQAETADSVRELSRAFPPDAFRRSLQQATDLDLKQARDEIRTILGSLFGLGLVFGRNARLLSIVQEQDITNPLNQIAWLLQWHLSRGRDSSKLAFQWLQELARGIPGMGQLLTPERLRVVFRNKWTIRSFEAELRELLARHRGDVDRFIEHHPEANQVFTHIRISPD